MTFDQAIDFFATHGNVTSDRQKLIDEKLSFRKLNDAVETAVNRGQPREVANSARDVLVLYNHVSK